MVYIFPDTNILIHGKDFEEIDWPTWLSAKDVTLVIAPIVIAELDKHKYNPNAKIARRVKKILPRLETIIEMPEKGRYPIQAIYKNPEDNLFTTHHLDKKEQDDLLLATILSFMERVNKEDLVVLVTNDTGPRLKAKSLSIFVNKLPEEFMHTPEPDESEKRIIVLEKELNQYKNKLPNITLSFEDGKSLLSIQKPDKIQARKDYIKENIDKIKLQFPQLSYEENKSEVLPDIKIILNPLFNISRDQVNEYNNELDEFYRKYTFHFHSYYNYLLYKHHCIDVTLIIKNTGFAPASDLDISLHFPDGFDVLKDDELPRIEPAPFPPQKPRYGLSFPSLTPFSDILPSISSFTMPDFSNRNVSSPEIKKTNSYDVRIHVQTVKHHQSVILETLVLNFSDIYQAKGFTIDYKILAANIPNPVEGKLNVKFENN